MSHRWHRDRRLTQSPEEQRPRLPTQADDTRDHRGELLRDRPLVEELTALLYSEDPIGLAASVPDDEYEPEAEAMAIWLPHANNLDSVRRQIHQDFVQWFGAELAGEPARYESTAQAVLALWHRHHVAN
jgi:hypothetical protein